MAKKPQCLCVLSAAQQGVSAHSFIHSFTLTHSVFQVQLATPMGQPIEFVDIDENTKRWISEFRTKSFATPTKLELVDAADYSVLLIPNSPGAVYDLSTHRELGNILNSFIADKKPICAIGFGVAALCSAMSMDGRTWMLREYSLTAPPVREMVSRSDFAMMPIILEDFLREHGASYTANAGVGVHVVIDKHLITGQNDQSTLTTVQNLVLHFNTSRADMKNRVN
ncbi:Parkinson disease 7 domain-containing protein 1 [Trichoplax sp. H2]|nr:Parkinson disease 7 domain-containing protein 1 [Trichoplax sp. H2]|eukprot:RDD42149.1 Parkinson disease 7 domain-containing protein 1 [Trichoplax sp. H2]